MKKASKKISLPVVIERDESGYYVGTVPSLRSCYTQAKTLPELYKRLTEVVALSLDAEKKIFKSPAVSQNTFIGVQTLEFTR